MALGRKKQDIEGKLLVLRIKTKDEKDVDIVPAVFSISHKKENGEWEVLPKTESGVSGKIHRLDLGTGTFDKKEYKTVKLYLVDSEAKETYLLDLRYNLLSRNLYNALLNLPNLKDDVSISLYKTTNKDTNKDYSNISLWQNDALVKGKFANTELPKPEELKNSKGEVVQRDYSNLDDFFEKHLKDLSKRIKELNSHSSASSESNDQNNDPLFENKAPQGKDLI
jgi:hypothetical protein